MSTQVEVSEILDNLLSKDGRQMSKQEQGVPVITTETANTTAFAEVQAPVKKTLKNKKKKRAVPAKPRVIKRSNPSAELEKKFEKEYLRKPSMSRMFQMIANEVAENCGATKGSNKPKKRRETSKNL